MWRVLPFEWIVTYFTVCSVVTFGIVWTVKGKPRITGAKLATFWEMLATTSTVTVVITVLAGKLLWEPLMSIDVIRKHVFPNLNGTWRGTVTSNWIMPGTQNAIGAIPVTVRLWQDFFQVKMKLQTASGYSRSRTVAVWPDADNDHEEFRLWYIYENETMIPDSGDEQRHEGAGFLTTDNALPTKLRGLYWTNRAWRDHKNTAGSIELVRVSPDASFVVPDDSPSPEKAAR